MNRNQNILMAVLSLMRELDPGSLEIIRREADRMLEWGSEDGEGWGWGEKKEWLWLLTLFFWVGIFLVFLDIFNKFYSIHHNQSSEIYNPKNNIKTNKMAHASKGFPHKGHIHANLMGMAWILFANLGLWCQYFQSSPIFVQLHTICMVIVIFLT